MQKIDISNLLASLIHESKHSLGTIMYRLESFKESFKGSKSQLEKILHIESELQHLNDQWVEHLYLYKLASDGYDIQYDTWSVNEFLDDQAFMLQPSAEDKRLSLSYQCPDDLVAIYDERLLTSVVSTGFYNALRYAKKQILFKAERLGDFLVISVEDDGPGFDSDPEEKFPADEEHTSLGLYFAELCAQAHNSNTCNGYIEKSTSEELGGASLKIFLPQ